MKSIDRVNPPLPVALDLRYPVGRAAVDWCFVGLMVSVWILTPTLTWTIIGATVWWLAG